MSTSGQGTKCRRNIAENCNRLIRVHERYRHDRRTGESTFAKSHMVYHGNTVDTMVTWYTMVDRYHVVLPYPKTIWYTRDYFCGNNRPGIPYFRVWYVSSSSGVATSVSELLYPCYLLTLSLHGTDVPWYTIYHGTSVPCDVTIPKKPYGIPGSNTMVVPLM